MDISKTISLYSSNRPKSAKINKSNNFFSSSAGFQNKISKTNFNYPQLNSNEINSTKLKSQNHDIPTKLRTSENFIKNDETTTTLKSEIFRLQKLVDELKLKIIENDFKNKNDKNLDLIETEESKYLKFEKMRHKYKKYKEKYLILVKEFKDYKSNQVVNNHHENFIKPKGPSFQKLIEENKRYLKRISEVHDKINTQMQIIQDKGFGTNEIVDLLNKVKELSCRSDDNYSVEKYSFSINPINHFNCQIGYHNEEKNDKKKYEMRIANGKPGSINLRIEKLSQQNKSLINEIKFNKDELKKKGLYDEENTISSIENEIIKHVSILTSNPRYIEEKINLIKIIFKVQNIKKNFIIEKLLQKDQDLYDFVLKIILKCCIINSVEELIAIDSLVVTIIKNLEYSGNSTDDYRNRLNNMFFSENEFENNIDDLNQLKKIFENGALLGELKKFSTKNNIITLADLNLLLSNHKISLNKHQYQLLIYIMKLNPPTNTQLSFSELNYENLYELVNNDKGKFFSENLKNMLFTSESEKNEIIKEIYNLKYNLDYEYLFSIMNNDNKSSFSIFKKISEYLIQKSILFDEKKKFILKKLIFDGTFHDELQKNRKNIVIKEINEESIEYYKDEKMISSINNSEIYDEFDKKDLTNN